MTFADDIEEAADGEAIEAVVIGPMGWGSGYGHRPEHEAASARQGEVLTWDEARPLLDYDYDCGYGAPDCHAINAWSTSKVITVVQYDGSTSLVTQPRHPVAYLPGMAGG